MGAIDRIKTLCKEQKINQQALAATIGVKEDTISNWFRGKSASYTKYLPQIAEALGTTTEYLLTGEGPKKKSAPAVSDSDTLTNEEEHLISTYRQAAPELQAAVRRVLGLE